MDIAFLTTVTAQSGDLRELARTVESLGYESLWIPEHPIIPLGPKTPYPFQGELPEHYGRWVDPFVALTVVATVTRKIKLATGICMLPEREPLITAKAIASLDYFSGGRVILGVGAGWLREETEAMGANFGQRWKHTREFVEAMRLVWTTDDPSFDGEIIKFPRVRSEPKPVQKSGPPIILGAHGDQALARVARTYDGWMPIVTDLGEFKTAVASLRKQVKDRGRNPDAISISPLVDPVGLGSAALKAYREAGANRLIMFSQKIVEECADGKALEHARRYASIVEQARAL